MRRRLAWATLFGLVCLASLAVFAVVFFLPPLLVPRLDPGSLTNDQRLRMESDLRSALVTMLGGTAVILGTFVAALSLRETSSQNRKTLELQRRAQVTERFTKAIEQVGNEELATRIGGIYALEQIARDSTELHWPIMETLSAFLREQTRQQEAEQESTQSGRLRADFQAAVTVIRRRDARLDPWDQHLDLSGASLQGADFQQGSLMWANFSGAQLNRALFADAQLEAANFAGAQLEGAIFFGAHLEGANFEDDQVRVPTGAGHWRWAYRIPGQPPATPDDAEPSGDANI